MGGTFASVDGRIETMKTCSKCKHEKPRSEFYAEKRATRSRDGLKSQCKVCHVGYTDDWANRHPEKRREMVRKSKEKHKITALPKARAWKMANKDKVLTNRALWIKNNPDRFAEIMRKGRKRWKELHPEAVAADNHKRRARKLGALGSFTEAEIIALFARQKGRCAHPWCREPLKKIYHRDHVTALSAGGSNFIENIQLLCALCNTRRGAKDPVKHMQNNGYLI